MTVANSLKPQTVFPDLPRNQPLVNQDGTMNMYWQLWFQNLVMALQTNFKNEGYVFPMQPQSNINLLINNTSLANVLYNTDTNMFDGNLENPDTEAQEWDQFAMIVFSAGNPNLVPSPASHKSGIFSTFCYDTVGKILYICTTTGTDATTVWTAV